MSITERIQEKFSAGMVYGTPVESDGMVVVPAARLMGGGGGGADASGGEGAGFGLSAAPSGAWLIEGENVRWKPAIDVTTLTMGAYVMIVSWLFFKWRIERYRAHSKIS